MRRTSVALSLGGAVLLALTGCGSTSNGPDGGTGTPCTTDSDCGVGSNQICHPLAKVCTALCTSSSSCPSSAPTCAVFTGPGGATTGTNQICQCSTDTQCGGGTGSSAICGTEDQICEVKCGSSADCKSGRTCDTTTGQCTTSSAQSCNSSSTTLGSAGGPDTCTYGDYCDNSNACVAAPVGSCSQATGSGAPAWNTTAKQAPVIVSASATLLATTDTTTQCTSGGPAGIVTLSWYAPNDLTTHTGFADLQNHVKFSVNGTSFVGASFPSTNPPANAQFGSLVVGIACDHGAGTTAAVYIQDESGNTSNVVCVNW